MLSRISLCVQLVRRQSYIDQNIHMLSTISYYAEQNIPMCPVSAETELHWSEYSHVEYNLLLCWAEYPYVSS